MTEEGEGVVESGEPEPQEETTTEEERVAATAALVAAENALAPTEEELIEMFAATAPPEPEDTEPESE